MASVLSIVLCFGRLMQDPQKISAIEYEDIKIMVSMLYLYPDVKQKACFDYDYVRKVIKPEVKEQLTDAIAKFCVQLHRKDPMNLRQWLKAVPLLHFLQGVSQPFGNPDPNRMWVDASLELFTLRQKLLDKDVK